MLRPSSGVEVGWEVVGLRGGMELEGSTDVGFEARDERVCAWLGRLLDFVAA